MRFSIIVPAHNSESYIRKALDSIREQTFTDYELIVVCNDCHDNTKVIAQEYTDKVFECCHPNCSMTHNIGLDNATGEYVMFVHDDDWLLHPLVLQMIDRQLHGEGIMCYGFIFGSFGYKKPTDNDGNLYPAVWAKAWKRSVIGNKRIPDMFGPGEDLAFSIDVIREGVSVSTWNEPIYFYNYLRPGSYSEVHHDGNFGVSN